jgi:hypothetical protein
MINRYSGEIRINPISVLRNDDFNNEGEIDVIDKTLRDAISINNEISERLTRLKDYLRKNFGSAQPKFNYAPGGYIAVNGFSDDQLLEMKRIGLIDLFDFATDRDWVKKYGRHFGLIWENGRAVSLTDL